MDFVATDNPSYINRHKVTDTETGQQFIKDIEFNFIELPKFNKKANELETVVDQWVYFIKNAENLQIEPENIQDLGLKTAYEEASKYNWTQAELDAYDYVSMREADDRGRLLKVYYDIARKLIKRGLADENIAEDTGLKLEQIIKLQNEL